MKIALGADHAGFELKEKIRQHLADRGITVDDLGTYSNQAVDYPDFARRVGGQVAEQQANFGILVCGSGIGMAIAANKVHGIRAANGSSEVEAQLSREHNDANVLTLGARLLDHNHNLALRILDRWLSTPFSGGHHQPRLEKIAAIEESKSSVFKARTGN